MRIPIPIYPLALTVLLVAAVVALPGCGGSIPPVSDEVRERNSAADTDDQDGGDADRGPQEVPEVLPMHVAEYEPTGTEVAVIETAKGTIRFEFFFEDAPNHAASFIELADAGFYDGIKFHRVIPSFMAQGGDPLSRTDDPLVGTGGPGYNLAAEFNDRPHLAGTVSMARRGDDVDSGGSQFFICFEPQPRLDGDYTVFGQVIEGFEVVQAIEIGDVMESVRIERPE